MKSVKDLVSTFLTSVITQKRPYKIGSKPAI